MKIKHLALFFFSCMLSYSSIAQTLLDPFGMPTTDESFVSSMTVNTVAASSSINIVNVIPSPTDTPLELAFDGQYLWVTGYDEDVLFQISPIDGSVIKVIPLSVLIPLGLTFDGEDLWLADNDNKMILQVDTTDGAVLSTFPSPADQNETYSSGLGWDGNLSKRFLFYLLQFY